MYWRFTAYIYILYTSVNVIFIYLSILCIVFKTLDGGRLICGGSTSFVALIGLLNYIYIVITNKKMQFVSSVQE